MAQRCPYQFHLRALSMASWLVMISLNANAQTWTGLAGEDNWVTPENWSTNISPSGSSAVYINAGTVVIYSGQVNSGGLTVGRLANNMAKLSVKSKASLGVAGAITLGASGGNGSLQIEGGQVTATKTDVGASAGGSGTLRITNGGRLTSTANATSRISYFDNSEGEVLIDGDGSVWETAGVVNVGNKGHGKLTVQNGGQLLMAATSSYFGLAIGDNAGSTGEVIIDGAGSRVVSPKGVNPGADGKGFLTIRNGGELISGLTTSKYNDDAVIGYKSTSEGTVIIEGQGSSWTSLSNDLYVGAFGRGSLTIRDGGVVSNNGVAYVAGGSKGVGAVLVTGAGSRWTTGDLDIAPAAQSRAVVTVADGGAIDISGVNGIRVAAIGDGEINIGAAPGQPAAAPGHILNSPEIFLVQADRSRINFNHTDDSGGYVLDTAFSGRGKISVQAGTTTLPTDSPEFAGSVSVGGGRLVINGQFGGTFSVGQDGTLGGMGTLIGNLTNAGTLAPGTLSAPGQYAMMTIRGDYVGNDGKLLLNTWLGADNSPTDMLVIDGGQASGSTSVFVTHTGLGAKTTGNGIHVIGTLNGATTATSAFSLGSRVAAGAYEYSLVRGGIGTPDDWYLVSEYSGKPNSVQPLPDYGFESPPTPSLPDYRSEVPVYMTAPALAYRLALATLGTYHDRVGERYTLTPRSATVGEQAIGGDDRSALARSNGASGFDGAWGRVFGESGTVRQGGEGLVGRLNEFEKRGPSYDIDLAGMQAGMDLYRRNREGGGREVAGVYVGVGRVDGNVQAVYGGMAGSMAMNAYSAGVYATRLTGAGAYVDGVMQGTWFRDVKGSSIRGGRIDTNGWGVTASLEGGYPIAVGAGLVFEPQAQLIYQRVSLDDGADLFGHVRFDDSDAIYGRIGARLTKNWTSADGRPMAAWARINLWHAFGSDADVTFSNVYGLNPTTLRSSLGGTWAQVGVGISGQVARNVSLFVSGDYNHAVGGGHGHGFSGRVGVRVAW